MAFSNLSVELQNLIMVNFEFFAKLFIFFGLLYFAIEFTKNYNPKEKPSFVIIKQLKAITYVISKIYIFTFFLNIFYFYPQVGIDTVLIVLTSVYGILFMIFGGIILPVNTLLYGSSFASDLLGFNNKTGDRIRKNIETNLGVK